MEEKLQASPLSIAILGAGQVGEKVIKSIKESEAAVEKYNLSEPDVPMEPKMHVPLIVLSSVDDRSWENSVTTGVAIDAIKNDSINVVVDTLPAVAVSSAYGSIKTALQLGKHVVSCNRELWVTYREDLAAIAKENGVHLLLNSLVVSAEGHSKFDGSLTEENIAEVSIEDLNEFRGADAEIVAESILKDLEILYDIINAG